jgi:hypothetical protein
MAVSALYNTSFEIFQAYVVLVCWGLMNFKWSIIHALNEYTCELVWIHLWLHFVYCNVSKFSIFYVPWRWPHFCPKHVEGQCLYELISIHLCAFYGTTIIYRVIKKSLCTWWLQYRKLQVMFRVSPASLQTFIGTRLTLTPSVIPNCNYVILVSDWNFLKYFCVFFYCNHQVHRDFLITLYIWFTDHTTCTNVRTK